MNEELKDKINIAGSWIAKILFALIAFFLYRLVGEIDETREQMDYSQRKLYEISTDVSVMKSEVSNIKLNIRDIKSDLKNNGK